MDERYLTIKKETPIGKYQVISLSGEFDLNEVLYFEEKPKNI